MPYDVRFCRSLRILYSLLFSLPGTPLIRYGDEIGMGDDLSLEERTSVRTVMQWSDTKNGGFSTVPEKELVLPVISGGDYGYERVNVTAQQRDPGSFLNWMERAIGIRKQCPEFGSGKWQILETDNNSVFAHCCEWKGSKTLALHNLSDRACTVSLDFPDIELMVDVFCDRLYPPLDRNSPSIALEAYGYRWLRANLVP